MDVDQPEGAAIADAAAATGAAAAVAGDFAFDAAGALQRGQQPGDTLRGDGGLIHRPADTFGLRDGRANSQRARLSTRTWVAHNIEPEEATAATTATTTTAATAATGQAGNLTVLIFYCTLI